MYGLVNRAIEGLIRSRYGDSAWAEVKRRADVDVDSFVRLENYPDEISYRLVAAASEVLDQPAEALLEAFGEYWTLYVAEEGYGELMRAGGSTLFGFLANLDQLHARVGLLYNGLRPPSFRLEALGPEGAVLHYYSQRAGLAPMVVGLLKGLAQRFTTAVDIQPLARRAAGDDHDSFAIRLRGS